MRRRSHGELIVDGSIRGNKLNARTITAEHIDLATLTGDLFVGEMILGSTIRTARLDEEGNVFGSYAEMGPNGIHTVDSNGDPVASFPLEANSGSYVKAHMDLLSAEVRDNFRMHGTNNSIAAEGELTLNAGVAAPSAPPAIQEVWDQVQLNKTTLAAGTLGTFALNPSEINSMDWNTAWKAWIITQKRPNGTRTWYFNPDGSIKHYPGSSDYWVEDYTNHVDASVCYNSKHSQVSHLTRNDSGWWFFGWAQGDTLLQAINLVPSSWILDSATHQPKLLYSALDDTYKLIQSKGGGNGTLHVRTFKAVPYTSQGPYPNPVSLSVEEFPAGSGFARRINGAVFGPQLTGGGRNWAITTDDYMTFFAFSSTGTQLNTDGNYHEWGLSTPCLASCWNETNFASVDSSGKITLYTNWNTTQHPTYMYFGASAYDSDPAGSTANPHPGQLAGQHETPVGTLVRLAPKRRSNVRVIMPETNDGGGVDDPDKWKIYFARTQTTDYPADRAQLNFVEAIGSSTAPTSVTLTGDPIGQSPPPGGLEGSPDSINNFPGSDPARIESAAADTSPYIQLRGDGAGRTGPMAWDSSGKLIRDPRNVGEVITFYGTRDKCPVGFLIMDGASFSSALYPELAVYLGSTVLPNMTDRVAKQPAAGELGGELTGSNAVTLGINNMPAHDHGNSGGHNHNLARSSASGGSANRMVQGTVGSATNDTAVTMGDGVHKHDSEGSGEAFSVMQRSMSLWHAIKAV